VTGAVVALVVGLTVLAGSLGWAARDRAARRAQNTQVVIAALRDADSWQQQRRLPEALSAARRAQGLLAGADVDKTLRERVRARLADLELLDKLENIRLVQGTAVKGGHFDWEKVDSLFRQTFLDAGLDIQGLPPEEAGERIRQTTVAVELASVLDEWVPNCRDKEGKKKKQAWNHLLQVARAADPDPWRTQVREAIEREDWKGLQQLAVCGGVFQLSLATLSVVGSALLEGGTTDRAVEEFLREAQRRHPDDFWLNHNLYKYCKSLPPPQRTEALLFAAVAVSLRPNSPGARSNLGNALRGNGRLDEAISTYREALRLEPNEAVVHNNLGAALGDKGRIDEAIAEYREAIRLDPSYATAHHNLGGLLCNQGRLDEGIAETREALRLNKDFVEAHYNLANTLSAQGQLDEAADEYRETIRLRPHYAEAFCNLGKVLELKGQFTEALVFRRRGHELGSQNPRWPYRSAEWVRNCERLVELDGKLPAILSGQKQPADTAERLALARLCQLPCKQRYVAAQRFFSEAFAADQQLAEALNAHHRYNAACAAALAGCGQGKDAAGVSEKERARLRQQALDWLRADLAAWSGLLQKEPEKARSVIIKQLRRWQADTDFACLRGDALARLPAAERQAWQELWADVADTLARAQGKTVPTK
jgi:tetratricopeptide (TPR) repeat protein